MLQIKYNFRQILQLSIFGGILVNIGAIILPEKMCINYIGVKSTRSPLRSEFKSFMCIICDICGRKQTKIK